MKGKINYSEKLIDMRREFLEYAKKELPINQIKSFTFIPTQNLKCHSFVK